jgi:hypothetical protein
VAPLAADLAVKQLDEPHDQYEHSQDTGHQNDQKQIRRCLGQQQKDYQHEA